MSTKIYSDNEYTSCGTTSRRLTLGHFRRVTAGLPDDMLVGASDDGTGFNVESIEINGEWISLEIC